MARLRWLRGELELGGYSLEEVAYFAHNLSMEALAEYEEVYPDVATTVHAPA